MLSATDADALYRTLGMRQAPQLIDVRKEPAYATDRRMLPGALRGHPEQLPQWRAQLIPERPIVVYCVHGHEVSQGIARQLHQAGLNATYLEHGQQGWIEQGYPTIRQRPEIDNTPSRWITRARPKIDRLACPWLIRRFIDPHAAFFYTPAALVREQAEILQAEPFDIPQVQFSHRGERCSFDAFLEDFELHDPSLAHLATIIRAADTGIPETSPQAHGLLAISLGLSAVIEDDYVLLEQAMTIYDGLYAWCKQAQGETHAWPQATNHKEPY